MNRFRKQSLDEQFCVTYSCVTKCTITTNVSFLISVISPFTEEEENRYIWHVKKNPWSCKSLPQINSIAT
jgi:hypothetical protein